MSEECRRREFVARVAQHAANAGVGIDIISLRIGDDYAIRRMLEERAIAILARAQQLLRPFAFGDILNRPHHPHAAAGAVAQDVPAVKNLRIGTISAAQAIFVGPRVPSALDDSMNSFHHPIPVLRMEAIDPGFDPGLDFPRLIAKSGLEILVPPNRAGGQSPNPRSHRSSPARRRGSGPDFPAIPPPPACGRKCPPPCRRGRTCHRIRCAVR